LSTFLAEGSHVEIKDRTQLKDYFSQFTRPACKKILGIEAEFFAVRKTDGRALPFSGETGIESILKCLSRLYGYATILDGDFVVALKKDATIISLEPGGQVELSAAPVKSIFEIEKQVVSFVAELQQVAREMPELQWLSYGIQPFSTTQDVTWVPKKRYQIMADYLGKRGELAHWMMKLTATNQVSFDYADEGDAMDALRTVFMLTPFVTALFANSNFWQGRFWDYQSKRFEIWEHTDAARTGILEDFIRPDATFADYLNYILAMPMIFIVREGRWIPMEGKSFDDFIKMGHAGYKPTQGDFELHLSAAFPEARIKQYLEVRGVDAQKPYLIPSVAAFWKGILYNGSARENARRLIESFPANQRNEFIRQLPQKGLHAHLGTVPAVTILKDLVTIAGQGLKRQAMECSVSDESGFLERLQEEILQPNASPADQFHKACFHEGGISAQKVLDYLSI